MPEPLYDLAARVGGALLAQGLILTTAESCTGGWIAKVMTDVPGSSGWFERGFVVYDNAAKQELLGVQESTLLAYGAVSGETVTELAEGALTRSRAGLAMAVSGIAGPDGGSPDKPVGMVWIGWARPGMPTRRRCYRFGGDREAVRRQAVRAALEGALAWLGETDQSTR